LNSAAVISKRRDPRILITGGGTGGHAYPAIAIADAIRQKRPNAAISFAGSRDKIEWRIVPLAGYPISPITVQGLQRKITAQNLLMPFRVAKGLRESIQLIQQFDADVVVGTGGFVALPILLAARYLVRPIVIQEQNAFMGLTNRLASRFADSIHLAFEEARPKRVKGSVHMNGNPVRADLGNASKSEGRTFFDLDRADKIILVFGGSLGSLALNEAMATLVSGLLAISGLGVIWQTGDRYFDRYSESVQKHPRLKMHKYIDRMDLAQAAADLAVCRSGASTCAELMLTGTPSIMVPSPNVAEDHQTKNARSIEKQGACEVLPEDQLMAELLDRVKNLIETTGRLSAMSQKALQLARPHAADRIAEDVLMIAEVQPR
jgi:UDP-N-acetylglucosamine--N-acetylmuramyl-(pentapeptide) pyrophosphoryl-undecaprenol N-acetylglucosamine transferase